MTLSQSLTDALSAAQALEAELESEKTERASLTSQVAVLTGQVTALTDHVAALVAEVAMLRATWTPPVVVSPPVVVPPVQLTGKYRNQSRMLFQGVGPVIPSAIPGGPSFDGAAANGPTPRHVDSLTGWPWRKTGGDWIDADGVLHGPKAWAAWTQPRLAVAGEMLDAVADVTTLAKRPGWKAWIMRCPRAQRKVLGDGKRPVLTYTYADGSTDVRPAAVMALNSSSTQPVHRGNMMLPVFVEFDQPDAAKTLTSASLAFTVTEAQWGSSGGPAQVDVYPLDPPMNTDPVTQGLSAAYPLDAGITAHADVLIAHTYKADETIGQYVSDFKGNTDNEFVFDRNLIDPAQPSDLTKLPHLDYGKWVGQFPNGVSLCKPGDTDYVPLHPTLSALRLPMKPKGLKHGDVAGYGGTLHSHAFLYLPSDRIYKQRTQHVRYRARLTYPEGIASPSKRLQLWADKVGGQAKWMDFGGKFGPNAGGHHTSLGGYSGSAGGGYGHQARGGWRECAEGINGPNEGGWAPSFHWWDYGARNPPGYNYGGLLTDQYCWGQRGGLGGMLYAGHWYDIEMQVTLNSVDQPAVLADGTPHIINGQRQFWTPDGEARAWIDGRLVYERTGMVFRTLPVAPAGYVYGQSRPVAPLGHVYCGFNVFHGGVTPDNVVRNLDIAALVVAESRIGPLTGV